MTLLSFLPLLSGWRYHTRVFNDLLFEVNQTRIIEEIKKTGWIKSMMIRVVDKEFKIKIDTFDSSGTSTTEQYTPKELYDHGLLTPNPDGWYCSKYDDAMNDYVVMVSPTTPKWFINNVKISATAKTATVVKTFRYTFVVIEDENRFRESLKNILSPLATYTVEAPKLPVPALPVGTGGLMYEKRVRKDGS